MKKISAMVFISLLIVPLFGSASICKGHFINPITDICWDCLFPITIGNAKLVTGDEPDLPNPSSPVCLCPAGVLYRLGLTIGYWEPFALVDVTRKPYCMVNLGFQMNIKGGGLGGSATPSPSGRNGFYYVHWYKYPVIYWLQLLTSMACMQSGDFDVAYLTELDPTWNNSQFAFALNPESLLFSNPIAQVACAADATKTFFGTAIDPLFWCQGALGPSYPLTGHVAAQYSPLQAAALLSERMDFKMHREGLIEDSVGENAPALCHTYPSAVLPKSRYRYELVNTIPEADQCHPFGQSTTLWEIGHTQPADGDNFGFLIWRKRNCCFL